MTAPHRLKAGRLAVNDLAIHRLCRPCRVKILAKGRDLAVRRAKEKRVFLTIFAPGRLYAPFGSDLSNRAIGVGERINTNVREPEAFNRTPEPLDVRLNRLASFEATGMSERWRKREFPKDVIGDERLPFSRAQKRFDVTLQKRGGDSHARSPFCSETIPAAPSSASLAGIEPYGFPSASPANHQGSSGGGNAHQTWSVMWPPSIQALLAISALNGVAARKSRALNSSLLGTRYTVGTLDNVGDALDSARIRIGDSADEILGRPAFPYARTKTGVELAVLSAADLGVESDQSSLAEVYQRAREAGLELCPAEVGPQLRLDYRNQLLGEALDIAMEPVATYSGDPTMLTLANWGTGLLLIGRDGRPESMVFRKSRFVFALPTKGRLEAVSGPQIVPTSSE
jgi:hypothetical protein